jgi:hypothetical protein
LCQPLRRPPVIEQADAYPLIDVRLAVQQVAGNRTPLKGHHQSYATHDQYSTKYRVFIHGQGYANGHQPNAENDHEHCARWTLV